jgi:hypothetical protein
VPKLPLLQARMQVVATWTGSSAHALQQALRMTNESYADLLGVAVRTVANWRKKPETIPHPEIQGALDTALERATDRAKAQFAQLIGEAERSSRATDRVEPVAAPLSVVAGPDFGDSDYLQAIRSHIAEIVALDNRFGAADLVKLSMRFFRTLHDHLGAGSYDPRLERDLHSAAGELAEVVGWLAYDAEEHDLCRRMNQESLYFTRLAGDKTVELLTLQNSSMHAAAQGRPREALQIARSVLEGDYRLSPRLRALFLTRKARALALGGDDGALALIPEIQGLFLDGVSDGDPAWAWWVDQRELDWHAAMIQRDLGLPGQAVEHFERSVMAIPADEIRSQYLHRASLLQAQVDNGTWGDAARTIEQLIPLCREVASTRTVVLLRDIPRQLAKRPAVPAVFREQADMLSAALIEAPI